MSLQEKFQITQPPTKEDGEDVWATFNSARVNNGVPGAVNTTAHEEVFLKLNQLGPGMNIDNTLYHPGLPQFRLAIASENDVSADTNPGAFDKGFTRREMKGTDDQYTGEHTDLFYGEAEDELGNVGFVERNNYMDRA